MRRERAPKAQWMGRSPAALALALLFVPSIAHADEEEKCIAANEQSIDLRRQGKLLDARAKAAVCAAEACPQAIQMACIARSDELNANIPSLVLVVRDAQGRDVPNATVAIDGQAAAPVSGQAIALDPGTHRFKVEAPGGLATESTFVLRAGERQRQEKIVLASVATSPVQTPEKPAPEPSSPGSTQRTIGLVTGGVGVAGLVVGSIFGGIASSQWSDAKDTCGEGCAKDSPAQAKKSDAESSATIATIGIIAGGVLLATGLVLYFTAPSRSATGSTFRVGPAGLGGTF